MARKPITVRLNDEEAELQEQAARVDAVSQNEFVRHAAFVLGLPVDTIVKAVRLDLAESALHATIACRDGNGFDWLSAGRRRPRR